MSAKVTIAASPLAAKMLNCLSNFLLLLADNGAEAHCKCAIKPEQ